MKSAPMSEGYSLILPPRTGSERERDGRRSTRDRCNNPAAREVALSGKRKTRGSRGKSSKIQSRRIVRYKRFVIAMFARTFNEIPRRGDERRRSTPVHPVYFRGANFAVIFLLVARGNLRDGGGVGVVHYASENEEDDDGEVEGEEEMAGWERSRVTLLPLTVAGAAESRRGGFRISVFETWYTPLDGAAQLPSDVL